MPINNVPLTLFNIVNNTPTLFTAIVQCWLWCSYNYIHWCIVSYCYTLF